MRARCDDDDSFESDCPPCPSRSPLRDYAKLIAALSPLLIALVKYGPDCVDYLRGLVAPKPEPEPAPTPRKRPNRKAAP